MPTFEVTDDETPPRRLRLVLDDEGLVIEGGDARVFVPRAEARARLIVTDELLTLRGERGVVVRGTTDVMNAVRAWFPALGADDLRAAQAARFRWWLLPAGVFLSSWLWRGRVEPTSMALGGIALVGWSVSRVRVAPWLFLLGAAWWVVFAAHQVSLVARGELAKPWLALGGVSLWMAYREATTYRAYRHVPGTRA